MSKLPYKIIKFDAEGNYLGYVVSPSNADIDGVTWFGVDSQPANPVLNAAASDGWREKTADELADELAAAEQARLMTVYERLRPEALEIFARLSEYAVEYSIVIDPATVTFTDLYATLWGVIPADDYERLRVLYENEVVAYEYEGNGKAARADFPGLLFLAQQELTQ